MEVEVPMLDYLMKEVQKLSQHVSDLVIIANEEDRNETRSQVVSEASIGSRTLQEGEPNEQEEGGRRQQRECGDVENQGEVKNIVIRGTMETETTTSNQGSPVAYHTRSREPRPLGNWRYEGGNVPFTQLTAACNDEEGERSGMTLQAPLLVSNQGVTKYQPFSHSDMTAVLAKLPPITSGGSRWLTKLHALCHGTTLAVGDIRSLLGQIFTVSQMADFEQNAGIVIVGHSIPYTRVSTAVATALRRMFPTPPTVYQNIKFRIKPGETGAGYYFRCAAEWEQMVEENSLNNPITRDIFRTAVMSGAPNGVKQALDNNPDMPGASNEVWERHLVFHIDKLGDKQSKELDELEVAKAQLVKLQLEAARGGKKPKQMLQNTPQQGNSQSGQMENQGPPTPSVIPPYFGYDQGGVQQPPWQQSRPRGGYQNFRGRGQGGRPRGTCFRCGSPDHWRGGCPYRQDSQATGPPAGGWGPLRGGTRGRGPQTSRHSPGQQHSAPHSFQAPMHPECDPNWGSGGDL
ncbi:MAG: hypothetical protein ACRC7H_08135, partial [Plesiomonas shigelloides]